MIVELFTFLYHDFFFQLLSLVETSTVARKFPFYLLVNDLEWFSDGFRTHRVNLKHADFCTSLLAIILYF